jgi:peptidoglycan hydrolase-like protein with peptidoglycan-binding domain
MKRIIGIFLIILAVQFFYGCAETNVQHIKSVDRTPESHNFNAGYFEVWQAVIHALSEVEIIKTMDKDAGVVVTEDKPVDDRELDVLKTALLAKTFKYSYTVNLRKIDAITTFVGIHVNLVSTQLGFYQREQKNLELESYLRKKLFTRIQNKLGLNNSKSTRRVYPYKQERQPPPSVRKPLAPSDSYAKEVQQALSESGYNPGPIDGIMGDKTKKALSEYQKDNGLEVTGAINDNTLVSLGIIEGEKPKEIASKGPVDKNLHDEPVTAKELESNKVKDSAKDKKELITTKDEQEKAEEEEKAIHKEKPRVISKGVISANTSMVSKASVLAEAIDEIPKGTTVDIIEKQGDFYKVRYNDKEGFVYSSFIKENM